MTRITWFRKMRRWVPALFVLYATIPGVDAGSVQMGSSTSSTPTISTQQKDKLVEIAVNPQAAVVYVGSNFDFEDEIAQCLTDGPYVATPVSGSGPLIIQITRTDSQEIPDLCIHEKDADIQYVRVDIDRLDLVAKIRKWVGIPSGSFASGGFIYITINSVLASQNVRHIVDVDDLNTKIGAALATACGALNVSSETADNIEYWVVTSCGGLPPKYVSLRSTNSQIQESEVALQTGSGSGTGCTEPILHTDCDH